MVVVPSLKSQNRLVMVPLEVSVKETLNGLRPLVGLALKAASGSRAPLPVKVLVELPPLLVNTARLVNATALVGALAKESATTVCGGL